MALLMALFIGVTSLHAGHPILMNDWGGRILSPSGDPLDTTISITFTIYDDSTGGNPLWTETHPSVEITDGLASELLGTYNAMPDTIFHDPERYLGITVGSDPEIEPRTRLVSAPYAFHSRSVVGFHSGPDNVDSGKYTVVGGDSNTVLGDYHVVTGGYGNSATGEIDAPGDSVISTGGGFRWPPPLSTGTVVCGGYFNDAWGLASGVVSGYDNDALGFMAFIGAGVKNRAYHFATVGGGGENYASGLASSIGGGAANEAQGVLSTIAGGGFTIFNDPTTANFAYDNYGTIGGGGNNRAGTDDGDVTDATFVTVSGGEHNYASGGYSTIPGGFENEITVNGNYSFAAGKQARADHANSFIWNDGFSGVWSTGNDNQFVIHAMGGVGIGTNAPSGALEVAGTARMAGFEMPSGAVNGYVLTCIATPNGMGSWQPLPSSTDADWDYTTYPNHMFSLPSGNVGIGTSAAPSAKLHVNDGISTTNDAAVQVDFSNAAADISAIGINVATTPLATKGSQIGARATTSINYTSGSNDKVGNAEGRMATSYGWEISGQILGVYGNADASAIENYDANQTSCVVGGKFRAGSASGITLDATGTYYFGGVYGEVDDAIDASANSIVAGVIGIDNATGTATSYAGYFDGKVNITEVLHLEPGPQPGTAVEGDMYMDATTHKLMVYDGTTWQACW
jgi:hypothetical protein